MPDRDVPAGPFTAPTAARSGWTPAAQRHAVRTGNWDRLQLGVFAQAEPPALPRHVRARIANLRRAQGAALVCERAVLSHASAAIAWELPVLGRAVDQACLTVQSATALRRLAKVHLHRAHLDEIALIDGFGTTPVARTVVDLAREHGIVSGLAAADAALHDRLTTPDELAAVLQLQRRWPGARAARFAVEFADARAESPLESVSRLRMHQHRLPRPDLQRLICDDHGVVVTRSDFYWDEFGVIGESDGAMKWEDEPEVRDQRDATTYLLEELGLVVVRWRWADLSRFTTVARRLGLAFARGAGPGSPQRRWQVRRP